MGYTDGYGRQRMQLAYSPSGLHAAYQTWEEGQSSLAVYDLMNGERVDIPLEGDLAGDSLPRPFFRSWTTNGLLAVSFATKENIGQSIYEDYPAGSTQVSFYSVDGALQGELYCGARP